MIPQTGGEVRMDFQGTDPCVTCGIKDVDEEVIIWKENNRFKKKRHLMWNYLSGIDSA